MLHTTLNGGRSRIEVCDWVRRGVTPYIGHWLAGRYMRSVKLFVLWPNEIGSCRSE